MSKDFSDEMIEKYGVPKPINNYKKNSGCMSILGMGIQILINKNKTMIFFIIKTLIQI